METVEIIVDKPAFKLEPYKGFTAEATYLKSPAGDALVEIFRDDKPYRRMLYPAYKVWNIAAHFSDIVDSEIAGDCKGYDLAGWTGFSVVRPVELDAGESDHGR